MPYLKEVQKKIPGADSVAGRVVAFHEGKHVDLGQYVGDGVVVLSSEGEKVIAAVDAAEAAKKPAPKKKDAKKDDKSGQESTADTPPAGDGLDELEL